MIAEADLKPFQDCCLPAELHGGSLSSRRQSNRLPSTCMYLIPQSPVRRSNEVTESIRTFGITTPPSRLTLDHLSRHRFGVVKRVLGLLLAQNSLLAV
jgi:hypothetical protein